MLTIRLSVLAGAFVAAMAAAPVQAAPGDLGNNMGGEEIGRAHV